MSDFSLKQQLRAIQEQDFCMPEGMTDEEAVSLVFQSLGSKDSELRDDLGYTILSQ